VSTLSIHGGYLVVKAAGKPEKLVKLTKLF
jgi:hypothetical protein